MGNPVTEHVDASRELSPVHAYIADHGEAVDSGGITRETMAGRSVAVSDALTHGERALIAEAIRAIEPRTNACFANALQMWAYDSRFKYAEGFAVVSETDIGGLEHAWCMLDGHKLVDVTRPFVHYHGVVITDDDTLRHHYEGEAEYGVIGNHANRFAFLREQGYIHEDDDRER